MMRQIISIPVNLPVLLGCLFLLLWNCNTEVFAEDDPVVIRVGEVQQTRSEFEQQFGTAMLLTAVQAGIPIKSGMQIRDLREHYLEQRVAEILLLQLAKLRGLKITETELDTEVADLMQALAEQYSSEQKSGLANDVHVRDYLREQQILRRIKQVLLEESGLRLTEKAAEVEFIDGLTQLYRKKTVVQIWPERLE